MKREISKISAKDKQRVFLTPLLMSRDGCQVACIAIRHPDTQEIVAMALNCHDLALKAGIPLDRAKEIFAKTLKATEEMNL